MKNTLSIICIAIMFLIYGCKQKPFVEHEIKVSKISESCGNLDAQFKLVSNFGGERFEFSKCLPSDFDKSQMKVQRSGDSVVVQFPSGGVNSAAFSIVLDIDSYPRYNYITIDDDTYSLVHGDNK